MITRSSNCNFTSSFEELCGCGVFLYLSQLGCICWEWHYLAVAFISSLPSSQSSLVPALTTINWCLIMPCPFIFKLLYYLFKDSFNNFLCMQSHVAQYVSWTTRHWCLIMACLFFFWISIYSVYHIKFFFLIDDSLVHIAVCTFNQFIYIWPLERWDIAGSAYTIHLYSFHWALWLQILESKEVWHWESKANVG